MGLGHNDPWVESHIVSWMQEGCKCIFIILWEKQFCAQVSFVFRCFLTSSFVHKNVNTLSKGLYYVSKYVLLHVLSISTTNMISPKMSLTTFLHSTDDMWPQQTWGQRSSRGQWPLVQVFGKKVQCIHILWCIFKSNITVIAKVCDRESRRDTWFENRLVYFCQFWAVKGVLHLWALFLKTLCIFSKSKAISDKVSRGSGQKCSKELKNHSFT